MSRKKSSKSNSQHETNAKAVISFLILLLGLGILYIFYNYKDSIIGSGMFQPFVVLSALGLALLVVLLFLLNPSYSKKRR